MFKFDKLGLPEQDEDFNMAQNPMPNSADVLPQPTDSVDPRSALRDRLYADLTAKAKARIEHGKRLTSENEVSSSDLQKQSEQESLRAFQSSLQNASDKMGSVAGKVPDSSGLDKQLQAMNGADRNLIKGRQDLFDKGVQLEDSGSQLELSSSELPSKWQQSDNTLKSQQNQFADRDTTLAKTAREADPSSQESVNYRTWLKDTYGKDIPPNMSATQLKEAVPFFAKKYEIDENSKAKKEVAYQNSLNRQETRANTDAINGAKQDEKNRSNQAKADEKEELISIPGFKRVDGMRVSPKSADDLRKGLQTFNTFQRDLSTLKDMVKEYGTYETGPNGAVMESLTKQVQLKYKELVNLGVLNGGDMKMIEGVIPSLGNKVLARNDNAEAQLDTLIKSTANDFNSTMPTFGYAPEGQEGKSGNPVLDNMFSGNDLKPTSTPTNGWSTRK